MTDLFGDFVSDEDIAEIFKVMYKSPRHTFQILTKRPERMLDWISRSAFLSNAPLTNAWLGVSVEDQKTADQRIPLLLETPAVVRWISAEPLLGSITLAKYYKEEGQGAYSTWLDYLNWVVVGGESGPSARPMNPYWPRLLRDQCLASDVRFLFKQWGEFTPLFGCDDPCGRCVEALPDGSVTGFDWQPGPHLSPYALQLHRVGKKKAGRELFGREWNEYPSVAEVSA
jgi:protein gp37